MAIACVWAPRNEIEMAYGLWAPLVYRIDSFNIPVWAMSVLMVTKEVLLAVLWQFPIGSELFHLVGTALGFGLAVSMLRGGWVDCEGWDMWSVWERSRPQTGSHPVLPATIDGRAPELETLSEADQQSRQTGRKLRALKRVHTLLQLGKPVQAWAEVQSARHVLDGFQLTARDLARLGQALLDLRAWTPTIEAYEEYIERFPQTADLARLLVAEVLAKQQGRPAAALRHLQAIDPGRLTGDAPQRYTQLKQHSEQLIDSGVIELEGRAWGSLE
jgi:tetratricopeptide (TPR) repeat protein